MIVLYLKANNQFLQAIKGFPEIKEEANKLLFADGKVIINDLTKAGYKEYPDQEVNVPMDEEGLPIPTTLEELNLIEFAVGEITPSEDRVKARELLANSPAVITLPEVWELMRIFGRRLGY